MTFAPTLRTLAVSAILALSTTALHQFISPDIASAADVDPINIYAQLPRTSSVQVSPDGKYVAMLAPVGASKGVFVYNLQNPDAETLIIPTPGGSIVKAIGWAGDKHIIMRAQIRRKMKRGKTKKYSNLSTRWLSTNVETQKQVILMQDLLKDQSYEVRWGGNFVHDLPKEPDKIMMSFVERAGNVLLRHYKVDLDSGRTRLDTSMPIDTEAVVRSIDGTRILAREEYDDRTGKYRVYVGESTNEKLVYESKFNTDRSRTTYLYTVIDGKPLLQESEQEQLTLFTIDPETKAQTPFHINASVPSGYEYGPEFDNHTRELIGVSYTDDTPKEVYFAEPYKTWHAKAKQALPGQNVRILSRTEDNTKVTIYTDSATNPGKYYLFEPNAGQISPLGGQYPELKSTQIGRTIRADYTARDGLKIPAYLTYPPGKSKANGPLPMVVMPHGGPIGPRDTASFDFWAQHIASQGYVVFKPQFRGSGGFGNAFREKGFGEFGAAMLDDTVDGVNHLIKTGVVQADKVCVTGASYGGYQALALPMVEPDMFKCAIAVNGVSDLPDMFKYEMARGGRDGGNVKWWTRVMGDYKDDRDKLIAQSPADNIEKIKAEILLIHGSDDATVPYQQAEAMAKALKKVGKSDDILILEDDDHNLSLAMSRLKLLKASEELFAKHLK